jgi:HEAT repeat protein
MYGNTLFDNIYFNITQKYVSNAQRSNALEIVDNMVDKDLRPIIVPLIELKDEEEKLKLGFAFFKIKKIGFTEIIETFLVDDSEWVRAITISVIATENIIEFGEKIEMFLYDPSPIVRESALHTMELMGIKVPDEDIKCLLDDPDPLVRKYTNYIIQPKNRRTTMILEN